ncbi:FAD-dependent oxidoreductase [Agrococcus jenensis]|uniref:3-phenylpropionate/trans-cinnamate dioxygenase ferredoxin reductase subunit n=1 Tax=Agrococcus jenensis TaxID=46353 RepID=A0A3N2AS19_9MICO|nr:NAD(P)/FAD-dependent oxidoreductase [Agrococcus jenensis]ROR65843.1 3-phenylpropionate/trans-cinnamate dioxygenase ferredoxin reductase subunit [Agrococcus jenensis]
MDSIEHEVVIVGAGAAGHSCARTLRSEGFAGRIRLVNGEGGPAINRTLVDTGVLPGLLTGAQIALPPVADVEVVDARAVRIDASTRAVVLDDGVELQADALVLASGSVPRRLDDAIAIDGAVRQHALHSAADAEQLRSAVPDLAGASIVVLGAGFIGAEVASHYVGAGARVTLIGRSRLPLREAIGADISARLAALHAERVDARLGARVVAIRAAGIPGRDDAVVVQLDDGSEIPGDALVVAVGSEPDAAWAGFDGSIAVDDRFRVPAMPGVYAAGSVSAPELPLGRVRVDHWDAATAQGAHAARALLHDLGLGDDPGAWAPTTGFSLMAYGAVIGARGVRGVDARETSDELASGGLLTDFADASGRLTGVAGWNAGPHLMQAAARL